VVGRVFGVVFSGLMAQSRYSVELVKWLLRWLLRWFV